MNTVEQDVLSHCRQWLDENTQPWLCTIIGTVGSSPRPVGSMAAITNDGRQVGTVSGGCIEEDLIARLQRGEYNSARPTIVEYGVTAEENERLGLPCGGRITLLLQQLGLLDRQWITEVLDALVERRCIERTLDLDTGNTRLAAIEAYSSLSQTSTTLSHCFGPRMRMLLVGAGQLSQSLAELGQAMDYEVLVTDPRAQFLDQWEGPAVERIAGMPDDVVRQRAADKHSIIITLTHDPRIDDMALMEALTSDAWYVGALGSQRTTQKRLERMRQLGISQANIEKLHAPVGLDIGSKTPLEIAVSIMAELTALRRKPDNSGG